MVRTLSTFASHSSPRPILAAALIALAAAVGHDRAPSQSPQFIDVRQLQGFDFPALVIDGNGGMLYPDELAVFSRISDRERSIE